MALIGDAACFVDPVFSTGVHLATYSALLAARSINSALANILDEEIAFSEFERRYRREYNVFYEYLTYFYDMHVDESSYFWSAKKVTNSTNSDLEAFVTLVAGGFSGEAVLTDAATLVDHLNGRSKEFTSAVDELVANNERSMMPIFSSAVVEDATREGQQIQSLAFGAGKNRESPLFEDGLIPSPDGMFWHRPS
jgi:halogenation protein CepH